MSATPKFTPGPWRATPDCFGDFTIQPHGAELAIAAVVNGEMRRMGGGVSEQEANARLIAAAPDMFEALKDALRSSRKDFKLGPDGDRQHREAYAEQFAALSKASPAPAAQTGGA